MTLDQSLANLQAQADRLAGLFAAVADNIEAGHGTITIRKDAAGQISRTELVYEPTGAEAQNHVNPPVQPIEVAQDTPSGVVAAADGSVLNYRGENYVPQPTPEPAFVQDPNTGAQVPVAPAGNPFTTAPEPEPAKKKGRRTHEDIARDLGVELAAVKEWLGPNVKVTKGGIEEAAAAIKAQAPQPAAGVTTPPDGSHLPPAPAPAPQQPVAGAYPGTNAGPESQPAPVHTAPAPEWTTGPDGQPAPVYAPPAPQQAAAPAPQYPQAAANPFGAPQGAAPDFGAGAVPAPQQPQVAAPQFSPFETQPYPAQQ